MKNISTQYLLCGSVHMMLWHALAIVYKHFIAYCILNIMYSAYASMTLLPKDAIVCSLQLHC